MIKDDAERGRARIIVDEWGPYDWKSPKLWPAGRSDEQSADAPRARAGRASGRSSSVRGATVSPPSGRVLGEIVVTPTTTAPVDFTRDPRVPGRRGHLPARRAHAGGEALPFSYSRFFAPIDWAINFFEYGDGTDPVKQPAAFAKLTAGAPLKTLAANRLDYVSGRALEDGLPRDRFALVARWQDRLFRPAPTCSR